MRQPADIINDIQNPKYAITVIPTPREGRFSHLRYYEKQLCRVVVKNAAHGEKFGPGAEW